MSTLGTRPEITMARLEKHYLKKRRRMIYTALEDLDFHWDEGEVALFDRLWKEGKSLEQIARLFCRDVDEAALLLMDRSRKRKGKRI